MKFPRKTAWGLIAICVTPPFISGCATHLSEDEQLEQEYARVEHKAAIRDYVYSCETNGNVVVYTGRTYHKLRDPVKRPPSHARLSDYQCVRPTAATEF